VQNLTAFTALGALASLAACGQRPYDLDEPEIAARYAHVYTDGRCESWLVSARTGYRYCASPAVEVDVPNYDGPILATLPKEVEEIVDMPNLMARGEEVYGAYCQTCHQADGKGLPSVYPPLAGSGSFYGDAEKHAGIIVKGLAGPIVVQGVSFDGAMAGHGFLSDYEIAAVATYERQSWGNEDGMVTPDVVAATR